MHQEDVTLLTMHDLVHDLARYVMVDEILDASKQGNITGRCRCRFALLNDCTKPLNSLTHSPTQVRAVRYLENEENVLRDASFSSAKYMRVLDLSGCSIQKLPDSIGHLKQLRYLKALGIKDKMIPNCITKLSKLIFLSISGSSAILTLPKSIGEMESLMYIDLSGCSGLKELPESFGKLKKLIHLDLSNCSNVTGVSESLESLINLKYLNLSYCRNIGQLPEVMGNLSKLVYLNLSSCSYMKGRLETEVLGTLTKLEYLNLSTEHFYTERLAQGLNSLINLKYLNLSGSLNYLGSSIDISFLGCLNNLEHLVLSKNIYLNGVVLPDCFDTLKKLHTLDLSDCPLLSSLPASIGKADSLKFVNLNGSDLSKVPQWNKNLLTLPRFVVQPNDDGSSSNLVLLNDVNPPNLQIRCLENVRSVKEVQKIELIEKQRIKELELHWTQHVKRSMEDIDLLRELVPPRSLKKFRMEGYKDTKYPSWLMDISLYLPNLIQITMAQMPKCVRLPPLGQLPNLEELCLERMKSVVKIDEDFCGGPGPFPRLKKFTIEGMPSLEVWNTMYSCDEDSVSEFMFPNLCELEISNCPKLQLTPCPPRAKKWTIVRSDGIISSWAGNAPHTSTSCSTPLVSSLVVQQCDSPLREWRLLHHLPALNYLKIQYFGDPTISAEIIGALSTLQSLALEGIYSHQPQLPDWLGHLRSLKELKIKFFEVKATHENITRLTSLHKLSLSRCDSLTSLPLWVGDLVSLQELSISDCPNLNDLGDCMGRLTSLKRLEIKGCYEIKSLPEGIKKLTMLEYMLIFHCRELREWCELEDNKKTLAHVKQIVCAHSFTSSSFHSTEFILFCVVFQDSPMQKSLYLSHMLPSKSFFFLLICH